jgi:glycogen debranching enzyme
MIAKPAESVSLAEEPFYIVAEAPLADQHTRVLKQGDTFAVFDLYGDVTPAGLGEEGLYHEGTRFLSCFLLRLGKGRPLFLSSTVKEDNDLLTVDLTNPDAQVRDGQIVPRGTLHFFRSRFLWQGICYERLRINNYGLSPIATSLSFRYAADFADIFEVRGTKRKQRGQYLPEIVEAGTILLGYQGLDGVIRRTRLVFSPRPSAVRNSEARFDITLPPKGEVTLFVTISCESDEQAPRVSAYDNTFVAVTRTVRRARQGCCRLSSPNEQFNAWLGRTAADLHMMTTETPHGPYPYAGVPWFSTVFGRDGIITALECLWVNPEMARGVLGCLAATQAREVIPDQDAEPGKIIHEMRRGEMAALGEIPFGRYYGSVDSTPLFIMLAGAYYERTADLSFIQTLWPHIELALAWIDTYGDPDGDGFVEYLRQSPTGLVQQGWKDSHDSVFHADGSLAAGPIALCEVQGYVYAARRRAAQLAFALGRTSQGEELLRKASELQERFEQDFWCDNLGIYALALDGDKKPCRVRASNAGHCLFTGIASAERARRTTQTLLGEDFFSGWGIRTLAASEVRYSPMSYHNGSVWPHDNALIAAGLARYGLKESVLDILTGLFDASRFLDLERLPELFCGFVRRNGEGPTRYPVACAPQSWAAASVFLLLQASLGLHIDATQARVSFSHPLLPTFLRELQIHDLRVGDASVDLLLQRHAHDVGINVLGRKGNVEVVVAM